MAASYERICLKKKQGTFSNKVHAKKLLGALNESRKVLSLCDGIVVIGTRNIPVQKNVLSAASNYFRAVYNYDQPPDIVMPSDAAPMDLTSLNISLDTFESILDFIYTSEINLSDDNIQDVLQAADILLMSDLKDLCCEYLEECISPQNCLGIWEFSARFTCPWIHYKVTKYICENFDKVCYSDEYLNLSADSLKKLLSLNDIKVKSENDVLDTLVRWFQEDTGERKKEFEDVLLHCVRASQIATTSPHLVTFGPSLLTRERSADDHIVRGCSKVIIVCGGEGLKAGSFIEVEVKGSVRCISGKHQYMKAPVVPDWLDLAPMIVARKFHGVVEVGGFLFAVGGINFEGRVLNHAEKYDPNMNSWTAVAPMAHARQGFGLLAVDDNIYAIGGTSNMNYPLTSIEKYNIFTNKWQPLPDVNLQRVWSAYAMDDKKLYVIAGGIMGKLYEAVECFDTRSETWLSVAPLHERRCDARAVGTGGMIYVLGGLRRLECPSAPHVGHSLMKFCGTEVYHPQKGHWEQLPGHTNAGLCVMSNTSHIDGIIFDGEDIYAVGELDVGGVFQCVRSCHIQSQTWRCAVPGFPPNQKTFQCAMFPMPNHMLIDLQTKRYNKERDQP